MLPADITGAAAERSLGLYGAPNGRDLGGLPTRDGRAVRAGRLWRTEALAGLTEADIRALAQRRLALVIDLRHAGETAMVGPDRLPDGQRVLHLPVYEVEDPIVGFLAAMFAGTAPAQRDPSPTRPAQPNPVSSLATAPVAPAAPTAPTAPAGAPAAVEGMVSLYRWFVADPGASRMFATAVREIIAAPGPALFHCTAGKDRTGWLAAILLSALGVDRALIRADYLLSNRYAEYLIGSLRDVPGVDSAGMLPVLQARPEYLDAAFSEVDERFGRFDRYLRVGLRLDDAALARLRQTTLA